MAKKAPTPKSAVKEEKSWRRCIEESEIVTGNITFYSHLEKFKEDVQLTKTQKELFKSTCFGQFLEMSTIKKSGHIVNEIILRMAYVDQPSSDELLFEIGGSLRSFSIKDFCVITGLKCHGNTSIELNRKTRLYDKFYGDLKSLSRKNIRLVARSCISCNDDERIKIALIYFLSHVLLGNNASAKLPSFYVRMVDDLEAFNNFPWGKLVWENLCNHVEKAVKNEKMRAFSRCPPRKYSVPGFILPLQVWAYETIPVFRRHGLCQKISIFKIPRILRWSAENWIPEKHVKICGLGRSEIEFHQIVPTGKDMELDNIAMCITVNEDEKDESNTNTHTILVDKTFCEEEPQEDIDEGQREEQQQDVDVMPAREPRAADQGGPATRDTAARKRKFDNEEIAAEISEEMDSANRWKNRSTEDSDSLSSSNKMDPYSSSESNVDAQTIPVSSRSRLRNCYATSAEQIKRALITNLVSLDHDSDVQFMSDLADMAFRSLRSLRAEYGDLYGLVRSLISWQTLLGKALGEIAKNGCLKDLMVRKDGRLARFLGAKKELESAKTALAEARAEVVEARRLLLEAKAKLVRGNNKVSSLESKVDKLEEGYRDAKRDEEDSRERVKRMIQSEKSRYECIASIERIKAELSALIDRSV